MSEKAKEILSNCFGYIIVGITCVLYILTTVFVLNPSGKTLGQIIGEGILAFCMGVSINHLLSVQGILNAMKTELVDKTMKLYAKTVEKISNIINKLGDWCHKKNLITYKRQRIKILARAGLKYDDCFYEDGTAKSFVSTCVIEPIIKDKEKLKNKATKQGEKIRIKNLKRKNKDAKKEDKYKRKCYWLAVNLKLSELYPNDLTSEGGKKDDPNYLGQTINEYLTISSIKDIVAKICLAIVFGIYGIKLIESFSWVNLIWTGFQICTFLCFGLIKMRMSYMFITNDYRGRIIKKIDNLEEFDADTEKNIQPTEQIIHETEQKGETENGKSNTTESVSG